MTQLHFGWYRCQNKACRAKFTLTKENVYLHIIQGRDGKLLILCEACLNKEVQRRRNGYPIGFFDEKTCDEYILEDARGENVSDLGYGFFSNRRKKKSRIEEEFNRRVEKELGTQEH